MNLLKLAGLFNFKNLDKDYFKEVSDLCNCEIPFEETTNHCHRCNKQIR